MQLEINTEGIVPPDGNNNSWQLRVAKPADAGAAMLFRVHISDPDMQQMAMSALGRNLKPQGREQSMLQDLRENWDAMKSNVEAEIARRIAQKMGKA
jgi:hypothetical protein